MYIMPEFGTILLKIIKEFDHHILEELFMMSLRGSE